MWRVCWAAHAPASTSWPPKRLASFWILIVSVFWGWIMFMHALSMHSPLTGGSVSLLCMCGGQGLVVGRVQFYEDGDLIDCTRMGVGGKAIPPYIDKITDVTSDAKFILVLQTQAHTQIHRHKAHIHRHRDTFTDTRAARKGGPMSDCPLWCPPPPCVCR